MADTQSQSSTSSPAEVEGYVGPPQQQQQQQQSVYFTPPADAVSPHAHYGVPSNDKSSRWSTRDDVVLCDALISQKQKGRGRDGAIFSMDAWEEVAQHLKGSELLSGGAEKSVVQCKARWQRLKIEYRIVKHIRQQPGFSWDEERQMVTALPATWDEYLEGHRDAQPWRKKSFPCYSRVSFLIEDENGNDKGDAKFKRRWESAATQPPLTRAARRASQHGQQKSQQNIATIPGQIDTDISAPASLSEPTPITSATTNANVNKIINGSTGGTTSVFSIKPKPQPHGMQSMSFVSQVGPGMTLSVPLNGGQSSIHQYRLSLNNSSKRMESPTAEQHSHASKRHNTGSSNNSSAPITPPVVLSQGHGQPPPPPPPQQQPETYMTTFPPPPQALPPGSIIYTTAPPPPGATVITVPSSIPPPGSGNSTTHSFPIHTTAYPAQPPPPSNGMTPVPIPPPTSTAAPAAPSRLAQAIQALESTENELSESEFVEAVRLFQRRQEAADAYLAIQSRRARSRYLRAELEEFGRAYGVVGAGAGIGSAPPPVESSAMSVSAGSEDAS